MRNPFEKGRRVQARAERQAQAVERVALRVAEVARRQRETAGRVKVRLLERLAGRLGRDGTWQAPTFPKPPGRRPGREPEDGGVPVAPDRPNSLSGGAAAAVEREDG